MFGRLKQMETREKLKGNRPSNKEDYTDLLIKPPNCVPTNFGNCIQKDEVEVKPFKGCRKFFQFYYTQTGSVQARHLSNEGDYGFFPLEQIETPVKKSTKKREAPKEKKNSKRKKEKI
eukprot:Anaeramoba_ignava/a348577_30.p3 GENE.a348577_30~~a348577_30.p3  ORF type:complete len:118 (+),score=35.37 a348577_30:3049-3402(+)